MTTFKKFLFLVLCTTLAENLQAQELTQTIRGTVADKVSQMPLPGANVLLLNTNPPIGVTTDVDGQFKINKVSIGNHTLKITFIGYKDIIVPNVIVNSGKEVVMTILLEEDATQLQEIVITATEKDRALNDMSVVSARTFSVEETRKFAAAVNDPARMVTSFAGVVSAEDGNNSISIRGNSPYGLLWHMEGIDIPNPNHFANAGTAGGGISILSSQLLANSDFTTGAFAAEYGNALSGVFDLKLRKGNNEKHEHTFQAGFLGMDAAAEGPLAKNYKGSYLVNYRYSTLSLLSKIGVPIGDYVTNFQDLSFNIHMPTTENSSLTVFGFGGLSDQKGEAEKDSLKWETDFERYNSVYRSNTGAVGIKYSSILNSDAHLQNAVVFSGNEIAYEQEALDKQYNPFMDYTQKYANSKITFSSVLNYKLSSRYNLRSGMYFNQLYYSLNQRELNDETNSFETQLNANGSTQSIQAFSQLNIKASDKLTLNAGIHYLQLLLNNSFSVEPRFSASYAISHIQRINIGYGLHSQIQPLGTYFGEYEQNGTAIRANENLGLSKSHHFVAGYDRSLNEHLRIKFETYYQHLYNIPVKASVNSSFSLINRQWDYETDPLVNNGLGRNYGVEITFEQFMYNNLYFLLSASLYESKYKATDNIWRDTRYNGNANITFTAGREFTFKKNRVFGLNIRTIYSGGFRDTPINVAESMAKGETVYYEDRAFTDQNPGYFRSDLRLSLKRNKAKSTHTLALDIQNVSNRKNVFGNYFEPLTGDVKTAYQTPLIPILSYKIEF
jgi:CarboxypepD_reg-like domain/TonB-dependent Receptor Plug Domain